MRRWDSVVRCSVALLLVFVLWVGVAGARMDLHNGAVVVDGDPTGGNDVEGGGGSAEVSDLSTQELIPYVVYVFPIFFDYSENGVYFLVHRDANFGTFEKMMFDPRFVEDQK